MKFRQICAAALAAVVLVSGCSKPGTESVDKYTRDGEGRVIPISDEYIPANYTPRSDDWSVMLREIPGSFGQETDKLIPAVYLTTSTPSAIIKEEYADESLLRNTAAFEMARSLGSFRFVPHAIPVDVYMNGIYQGVYTLGEQLEVKTSRIAIDDSLANVETGYLLEIGGADPSTDKEGWNYFNLPSGCGVNIKIKSPDTEEDPQADYQWTQKHFDFIYDYMCKADAAITTLDGYEKYINVDSFIDWFLVHELSYNLDSCFRRSCYITKPTLSRLEMGPIWDFDLAFGNMYMDNPKYDDWATIGSMDSSSYIGVTWFNYLMTDEDFRNKARTRWNDVRDTMVNAALGAIDAYKPMVIPSAEENFEIWNTLGVANGFQPLTMKNYNTYLDQVLYLRKFINNRAKWIDENL